MKQKSPHLWWLLVWGQCNFLAQENQMNRLPLHLQPTFQQHICQTSLLDRQLLEGALFLLKCLLSSIFKAAFCLRLVPQAIRKWIFWSYAYRKNPIHYLFLLGPPAIQNIQRRPKEGFSSEARATLETETRDRTRGLVFSYQSYHEQLSN